MVAVALGTTDGGNRGAVKLDKSANNHRHIFFGLGCRSPSVTILADAKQQIPKRYPPQRALARYERERRRFGSDLVAYARTLRFHLEAEAT
jgi:hypothetical protein